MLIAVDDARYTLQIAPACAPCAFPRHHNQLIPIVCAIHLPCVQPIAAVSSSVPAGHYRPIAVSRADSKHPIPDSRLLMDHPEQLPRAFEPLNLGVHPQNAVRHGAGFLSGRVADALLFSAIIGIRRAARTNNRLSNRFKICITIALRPLKRLSVPSAPSFQLFVRPSAYCISLGRPC